MSRKSRETQAKPAPAPAKQQESVQTNAAPWYWAVAALVAALIAYTPALRGPFLLDDRYLPFWSTQGQDVPLSHWLKGGRPLLNLLFYAEGKLWGLDPFPYHLLNWVLHCVAAALCLFCVTRILNLAGVEGRLRTTLSWFAGLLFLLHPLQTEAVSYIASLSETLSVTLFLGAFAVYLKSRNSGATWTQAIAVMVLFGMAAGVKEHTVVFPALVLLTDLWWRQSGKPLFESLKANRRLYALIAITAAAGAFLVFRTLLRASSAGFAVAGISPADYFFTQCRALWRYVFFFFLPVGQNIDHGYRISHSLFEPAVLIGLIGLLAATFFALRCRREYPLAGYGWLSFLILLGPTSSFVPIADALVERRLYLAFLGLALVSVEALRRWTRVTPGTKTAILAGILLVLAALTYQRNEIYSSSVAMWQDSAEKNPANYRAQFQLGYALFEQGRCADAIAPYERASALRSKQPDLLIDWGLALDCAGSPAEAATKLREAIAVQPDAHAYATLGMLEAKQNRYDEALTALAEAERRDPRYAMTYVYRGNIRLLQGHSAEATAEYGKALQRDPNNSAAQQGLATAQRAQQGR